MLLFIDSHLNDITIFTADDNKIISKKTINNELQSSEVIMPTIKEILCGKFPDLIIVVNGPGSFTGVRIAVTIAKTLAFCLNIPIKTITSLECLAVSISSSNKIVAFNDKNGYYIGTFNSNNELISDYEYLSNSDFKKFSENNQVFCNVELNYVDILSFLEKRLPINPHMVNPIYVKKIEVEK